MGLAHVRRGTREMWEQGHGLASVQEEVEAWASIRSKFSLRVVRLGLALERDLAHKCIEKYYFFTFIVALAQRSYLIHESYMMQRFSESYVMPSVIPSGHSRLYYI